jgi:hypothetical protein
MQHHQQHLCACAVLLVLPAAKMRSSTSVGSAMSLGPQAQEADPAAAPAAAPAGASKGCSPGGSSSGGSGSGMPPLPRRSSSDGGARLTKSLSLQGKGAPRQQPHGPPPQPSTPGGGRASYDSSCSRVTASSARSSFAAEVVEVDCYGRPSFSAFAPGALADNTKGG